ncbi:hypothetical protein [Changchengzhania lutea]|uniref:hypothetical protein n=1 Tax=Changchengzhania lutea TaxID=2049305 RepID=UPI00115C5508|nr:hypothetical protein [Changchengzhania lutea]
MNKNIFLITVCLISTLFSCNVEGVLEDQSIASTKVNNKNKDVTIIESDNTSTEYSDEHCKTIDLIAGQHHIAGTVTIDIEGGNMIITYQINLDWTIDATHLHITNCEADGFPVTGANNPKIGNFDYSSTHEEGVTEVTYIFNLNDFNIDDAFCFAAHAEVSGPSEETAWAEGEDFGGKSWAMFVEANLTDCEDEGDDDGGGPF